MSGLGVYESRLALTCRPCCCSVIAVTHSPSLMVSGGMDASKGASRSAHPLGVAMKCCTASKREHAVRTEAPPHPSAQTHTHHTSHIREQRAWYTDRTIWAVTECQSTSCTRFASWRAVCKLNIADGWNGREHPAASGRLKPAFTVRHITVAIHGQHGSHQLSPT